MSHPQPQPNTAAREAVEPHPIGCLRAVSNASRWYRVRVTTTPTEDGRYGARAFQPPEMCFEFPSFHFGMHDPGLLSVWRDDLVDPAKHINSDGFQLDPLLPGGHCYLVHDDGPQRAVRCEAVLVHGQDRNTKDLLVELLHPVGRRRLQAVSSVRVLACPMPWMEMLHFAWPEHEARLDGTVCGRRKPPAASHPLLYPAEIGSPA